MSNYSGCLCSTAYINYNVALQMLKIWLLKYFFYLWLYKEFNLTATYLRKTLYGEVNS